MSPNNKFSSSCSFGLLLGVICILLVSPSQARLSELRRRGEHHTHQSNPIRPMIDNAIKAGQGKVRIPAGTYYGQLIVDTKNPFAVHCDKGVTITYDKSSKDGTNEESSVLRVQGSPDFKMYGCEISNTYYTEKSTGQASQALAVSIEGNGTRASFYGTVITSWQDTLYGGAGTFFYGNGILISGAVDFVFGEGSIVIHKSTINSLSGGGSSIAASRGKDGGGIFFKRCKLTLMGRLDLPGSTGSAFLGRPWDLKAKTGYFDCTMGDHIDPKGWKDWGDRRADAPSVIFIEYNSVDRMRHPINTAERNVNKANKKLNPEQLKKYTVEGIFNGNTAWIDFSYK